MLSSHMTTFTATRLQIVTLQVEQDVICEQQGQKSQFYRCTSDLQGVCYYSVSVGMRPSSLMVRDLSLTYTSPLLLKMLLQVLFNLKLSASFLCHVSHVMVVELSPTCKGFSADPHPVSQQPFFVRHTVQVLDLKKK